jgi:uncharacterized protein (TIGR01777 family)
LTPKNILITGASGLIGSRLTAMLLEKGYRVTHLGRTRKSGSVPSFVWDIEKRYVDPAALAGADAVIHLAGAGVADKRWTDKRKQEILDSRVHSTSLLHESLIKLPNRVQTVVAASAIGYYGFNLDDTRFTETSAPGTGFLAEVVHAWEQAEDKLAEHVRLVKMRVGIVLSEKGGALKELAQPVKMYVGSPLGTGRQYMSWIHIDDVCRMFMFALEQESLSGAFNATGPYAVTNRDFTHRVAAVLNKPVWLPAVPAFVLKALLGELASVVLYGSVVSSEKIQNAGFSFNFPTLDSALQHLLAKH